MNKLQFLKELRGALAGLPQEDIEERIAFYGEMIDDRMEEGLGEEEAVAGIGPVGEIRAQTVADISLPKLVTETVKPKRSLKAWEIVLIVLGFPVWLPLFIAAGAIVLSLYIVVWALIVSLWAVEVSLWASVIGGIAAAVVYLTQGAWTSAMMMLGAALAIGGGSIFLFFGCVAGSKGIIKLTKKIGVGIKSLFIRKGEAI